GELALGQELIDENESAITEQMISSIKTISRQRHPNGVVKRFNQSKGLGCFDATFETNPDMPENLRVGIFTHARSYPAKIRFANASKDDDNEKDFRGMSIKVSGVDGKPLWGERGIQDFVLNSHPALFAANASDFLDFIEATRRGRSWAYFINPRHFYSLKVVLNGRKKITSPFDISYFSTTPYRFGTDESRAVKYSVKPYSNIKSEISGSDNRDYLSKAMQNHLERGDACFDFQIQLQKVAKRMPIENAAIIWNEVESPFISVAKITIKNQDFLNEQAVKDCENMSFNPWQSLPEHKPIGGINRVRRAVYAAMSDFRYRENQERLAAVN
ncbi:MAG: catalase family protein, partial [Gammaproteobacteria bacterium]|nr:catalase family protein [Gammaproteobacteria bacterium]